MVSEMKYVRVRPFRSQGPQSNSRLHDLRGLNWQPWLQDEEASLPRLKHAYGRGIDTWDVADTYSNGISEEIVGKALKKYRIPRAKVVILTKCFNYVDNARGPLDPVVMGSNMDREPTKWCYRGSTF